MRITERVYAEKCAQVQSGFFFLILNTKQKQTKLQVLYVYLALGELNNRRILRLQLTQYV